MHPRRTSEYVTVYGTGLGSSGKDEYYRTVKCGTKVLWRLMSASLRMPDSAERSSHLDPPSDDAMR